MHLFFRNFLFLGLLFFAYWPIVLAEDSSAVVSYGKTFPELEPFDELMEAFVRDNELPGASLAVAKDPGIK